MQLPEKYKENFDVSSEGPSSGITVTPHKGPSLKTSKFSPTNERLFIFYWHTYTRKNLTTCQQDVFATGL
jgi:hypothetical protein